MYAGIPVLRLESGKKPLRLSQIHIILQSLQWAGLYQDTRWAITQSKGQLEAANQPAVCSAIPGAAVVRAGIQSRHQGRALPCRGRQHCMLLELSLFPSGSRLCQCVCAVSMEQQKAVLPALTKIFQLALPVDCWLTQVRQ